MLETQIFNTCGINKENTSKNYWYFLSHQAMSGQENMDFDRMLLEKAANNELRFPVLRFYKFSEPTITIGYHQKESSINTDLCEEDKIPIVVRPTGGRAILHSQELTYSVTIPRYHPLAEMSIPKSYMELSISLIKGLRLIGIDSKFLPGDRGYINNPSCFSSSSKYEIAFEGKKFIGSAQKRLNKALLQQGSILLDDHYKMLAKYIGIDDFEDKSTSVKQILGYIPDRFSLESAFKQAFQMSFNIEFLCFIV